MYADKITDSMQGIDETDRRRAKQIEYNEAHGVDPQPLRKKITTSSTRSTARPTTPTRPSMSVARAAIRHVAAGRRVSRAGR